MSSLPEREKPALVRFREILAAYRFVTFSVVLHLGLIFVGGSVVLFKQIVQPPDFAAEGGLVEAETPEVTPPPAEPVQTYVPEAPQFTAPTISAIATMNINTPTFQLPVALPAIRRPPMNLRSVVSAAKAVGSTKGPVRLPATMGSRLGGTARSMAIQVNGGKKESEEAVVRGLRYLVKTQNPDGSWGKGLRYYISGITGLSVLSFLGHGETPDSTEFGPTVKKAIDWIAENGANRQGRLSMEATFTTHGVYAHGITTYALSEYYTMTRDERVVDVLQQALAHIVKGQSSDGSWRYGYSEGNLPDTSVSGWQIQALKAGHLTGLNVPGVDTALDKSMLFLKSMQGPRGGFGYQAREDRYSLTGVGVLCTTFWRQRDPSALAGVQFMLEQSKVNYPVMYTHETADLYAWYYNTQACLMVGGVAWNTWNRLFQDQIVRAQSPDGSWPPVSAKQSEGAELQRDTGEVGQLYRTNLCILMLEVYYRYMPTTR